MHSDDSKHKLVICDVLLHIYIVLSLKIVWILPISEISVDNKAKLRDGSYRISATDFRHLRRSKLVQAALIDLKSFIRVDCIQPEITLWGFIPPLEAIQANPSQSHPTKNILQEPQAGIIQPALIYSAFKFTIHLWMSAIYIFPKINQLCNIFAMAFPCLIFIWISYAWRVKIYIL